ncbi:MAG TPA: response regulator transcription factor [Caulobacteraceae bacterium]|jgi:DNA-binding NarL/FixJ family response regulator
MRAVVVCRFPIYREALARLVGSAFAPDSAEDHATLQEALESAAPRPLDMLVVDISGDDPEFRELKAAAEAIKPAPLVLFSVLSPAEVQAAYEAGVKGCIPKTAPPELINAALRLILAGGLYFSDFSSLSSRQRTETPLRTRLSSRQMEVLRLIEMGQTNKEIAKALGISVATVKLHVQAILNITGARNRTEAALRARGQFK